MDFFYGPHDSVIAEIASAQRAVEAGADVVGVDTHGTHYDASVVATQQSVEGHDALGFEVDEDGIDELDYVEAFQAAQGLPGLHGKEKAAELARVGAMEVDVARVLLPAVAVTKNDHLVPESAEAHGETCVDVAVFAYQSYAHVAKVSGTGHQELHLSFIIYHLSRKKPRLQCEDGAFLMLQTGFTAEQACHQSRERRQSCARRALS